MFHMTMEIESFNSDLNLKKCGITSTSASGITVTHGERKLIDRALEERRKGFRRTGTAYM
ncbi:uncharacterized protein CELE_C08E8.9 [Caenorhabditis elegans]|uniref:Uncharacterized protein n=1 Tax=Caenorhabditis elegans TaxID=6239 RepID=Q7YX97_CAEEL|nr:Uncharacterized protein CELE_C08E8.6 [Caenorhabditis elegans]NP_001122843.2 Uncharacterized protein CELE_C08E8.9 [Caenorhabditis elegans]CAE17678.2 Uncharacterized protein CELE_C08E8.6 [Caenorhabditis elegans]CAP09176.2 Uncharacterized protein CELE_C08E8.9 [Caenorhabditis elegans]|eukprot:NP_001023637.2 Uncharacterized protein CELE_C08E8.6 [Caenorhabditis elegans]